MKKRYNQAEVTVLVDGIPWRGLADGDSIEVADIGGEADITEGTDGPGVNLATKQGGYIKIKLREDSPAQIYAKALRLVQENALTGRSGVTVQILGGTSIFHTLHNAFISAPGALTTGGKKQGATEFKLVGTELVHNY